MKNPAKLLQLKRQYEAFYARHPKFMRYLAYIIDSCMEEGTVMDVTVTAADGKAGPRNARQTPPRNADPGEYHHATALEALIGWLYVTGQQATGTPFSSTAKPSTATPA